MASWYIEEAQRNRAEDLRQKKESEALLEKQAMQQMEEDARMKNKAVSRRGEGYNPREGSHNKQ